MFDKTNLRTYENFMKFLKDSENINRDEAAGTKYDWDKNADFTLVFCADAKHVTLDDMKAAIPHSDQMVVYTVK